LQTVHAKMTGKIDYSPITLTCTFLVRGPSYSLNQIPCHVPNNSLPPVTISVSDGPTRLLFVCAAEFPSLWRNSRRSGEIAFNAKSTSWGTSGSAFSLIVTAAVVCGTKTTQIPSRIPEAATAFCTSAVMLIQQVCSPVRTLKPERVVTHAYFASNLFKRLTKSAGSFSFIPSTKSA